MLIFNILDLFHNFYLQKYTTEIAILKISFGIILFSGNFAKYNELQKITNL